MTHQYGRLQAGFGSAGRGIERHDVHLVMTEDGKTVARLPYRAFSTSAADIFISGREHCHAWCERHPPLHDDTLVATQEENGTPPFRSVTNTITANGIQIYVAGREDEVAVFRQGWRHALRERGLISNRQALKLSARSGLHSLRITDTGEKP